MVVSLEEETQPRTQGFLPFLICEKAPLADQKRQEALGTRLEETLTLFSNLRLHAFPFFTRRVDETGKY